MARSKRINKNMNPPKWADRFLNWYCRKDLLEEIQGDVHELFFYRLEHNGYRVAKTRFVWDVIRFFRLSNMRKSNIQNINNMDMIRSYFKVGFRNILKNRLPSFINIFGLSTAVGCAIVIFIFLDYQLHMDDFHEHADDIYMITNNINRDGQIQTWGDSPKLLGPALKEDFDQIQNIARIRNSGGIFRYDDKVFNEFVQFADPQFLEMFTFELKFGNEQALYDKNAVVISNELAAKYFGDENPIDKQITITFRDNQKESFLVKGVAGDFPKNASFVFSVLANYSLYDKIFDRDSDDWKDFTSATFIHLNNGEYIDGITSQMDKYLALQNEAAEDWKIQSFGFQSLRKISLLDFETRGSIADGGHPASRLTMSIIGIFLLAMACLNYINVAIVSASTRLKEIGLRKAIGGSRASVIRQFLTENLILCFIALILGLLLAYFLFLPGLNSVIPIEMPFHFSSIPLTIVFFVGLLMLTGFLSGAYPAFYISSFKSVNIFRGKERFGRRNIFARIFITFQFVLAFTTIIGCVVFTENSIYFKNKDWGYDQEQVYVVPLEGEKQYTALRDVVEKNPNVVNFAGSSQHIARANSLTVIELVNEKYEVIRYDVGFNYLETMGLTLKEGRFFEEDRGTDMKESIIINQKFATKMGWLEPLGKYLEYDSAEYRVIGVVEDFHHDFFYSNIEPLFFRVAEENDYNFLSMRVMAGTSNETADFMKNSWKQIAPDFPYKGFFQDEVFERQFQQEEGSIKILAFVATLALILSCIGLFGLVSFNITKRMKEISIRKVLGANMMVITKLINNNFIWLMLIAVLIGGPLGYFMMDALLDVIFKFRKPITGLPFIIGGGSLLLTAILTVSSQVYKVAKSNPAETLRDE
ncbi:ABC transporter permease [Fulvivirgaceae bacterium BMA10]|uniref:ABC transporter permease n=1 Tax=Splendidivirga corallicola TaxID=3051826 RepID=A0ABT8KUE7_9BACT|nr:ABC transporter permease [Fulvivirgaceae bacterium BMA10]